MVSDKKLSKIIIGSALIVVAIIAINQIVLVDLNIEPRYKFYKKGEAISVVESGSEKVNIDALHAQVVPAQGVTLPIEWGDLGKKMVDDGVIDETKFRQLFQNGLSNQEEEILSGWWTEPIVLDQENSRFLLDVLWAFGLANKNEILTNGEMTDPQYGGEAGNFAATGGWSLSTGKPMDHYSMHSYVTLNKEQQDRVDSVSRGIYRPCCGNSTHFPDCNHGMAMLGLLQLMAANNATEKEMYEVALRVNSYWFPQTYVDLATYFKEQGTEWKDVDPQLVLGKEYSSSAGYAQTRSQIKSIPQEVNGGGGCGA